MDDIKEYRKELRKWYKEKKNNSCCAFCGKKKKLQFHHANPDAKVETVSHMVHRCAPKWEIEKEMKKCIILCRKCHVNLHKKLGTQAEEESA